MTHSMRHSMIAPGLLCAPSLPFYRYKLNGNVHDSLIDNYFFFPLPFPLVAGTVFEAVDISLDALEDGAAEVALLPAPDLMLSRALFCRFKSAT